MVTIPRAPRRHQQRRQNITFPDRKMTVNPENKPYFIEKLSQLKSVRQREYSKHGRSTKYLEIKESFEEKLRNEKLEYIETSWG